MAGGQDAVFSAKEGVEDNYEEGARSIGRLRLGKKDVVIGVSASGMTPFVRGGLTRARKAGAKIIFVTCWPGSELQNFVDLQIAPAVGPEIIAGSTRLKAGTATKLVLNMLTTIAMIKLGKTYGNLMVDVQTGSEKLKDRARRIVMIVAGVDYDAADALLKRAKWNVKIAIVMQRANLTHGAGAATSEEGQRLGRRGDRRRRRLAAQGTAERANAIASRACFSAEAAASSSMMSTSWWSCRNDAGSSVVTVHRRPARHTRPSPCPVASRTTARARRIVAIPIDNASAGTWAGSPPKSAALLRRVSGLSVTRWVRAWSSARGLVEPDVPVRADPENLQIDAARVGDRLLVARRTRRPDRGRRRRGNCAALRGCSRAGTGASP